jgi:predicted DNA-binding ribbon-helix-helix protein
MSAITFRLPDSKHDRLKELAKNQKISVNKLLEELTTIAITEFDAKTRFEIRASKANIAQSLKTLDKL